MTSRQAKIPGTVTRPSFVPRVAKSVFPDATPEQLRFLQTLIEGVKASNDRLAAIENSLGLSGGEPRFARKGEDYIFGNALVHVDEAGIAWLAVNTDSSRYVTHVVESVAVDQVKCVPAGIHDVRCLPFADTAPLLYLSSQPGFATDTEPDPDAGQTVQIIGKKQSRLNENNGRCSVAFQPEIPGSGHGSDRDIDGGTFDERDVLIQLRRGSSADRDLVVLDAGEPGWDSQIESLYIGDGSTAGGILVGETYVKDLFISGVPTVGQKWFLPLPAFGDLVGTRHVIHVSIHASDVTYLDASGDTRIYIGGNGITESGGVALSLSVGGAQFSASHTNIPVIFTGASSGIHVHCPASAGHGNINVGIAIK